MEVSAPAAAQSLAHFDHRLFFEKVLAYGRSHGILTQERLDRLCEEAPKGMVQLARYFGTEYLRPDLEKARLRIISLVSLSLEVQNDGDLRRAAESLRDNTLLSRSKAGADMLKALLVMPQSSHFGMNESKVFNDTLIPKLDEWSFKPAHEYRAELQRRSAFTRQIEAARWFAAQLELDEDELHESGHDADAIVRTGLLALNTKRTEFPEWKMFEKLVAYWNQQLLKDDGRRLALPKNLPESLVDIAQAALDSIAIDVRKASGGAAAIRKLFQQTPAFMGRYYWLEESMVAVVNYDRAVSKEWAKATEGSEEESALLTLFLCIAAGAPKKTLLTEKSAATLVRRLRKNGWQPELASDFIRQNAPFAFAQDYLALWEQFVQESAKTLLSDMDYQLHDALALLRRECQVQQ
ncbi:hypothetical protein RQP54_12420 [Curvibacter sp. APW13]|uniref:hypothetical protein n=1 Tax=Curvibacter sp. APW13 TaxID=3077236 RepID=UPI0028E01F23|nr:hypothetical protein [Curvibacter sp. APW13]MDT8991666.1 hypothetical protein [Curvibacter sp. APW13]